MKYLILSIVALLLYACGNGNRKQNAKATSEDIATITLPKKESANAALKVEFDKEIEKVMGDKPIEDELHKALSILNGWYAKEINDADEKITLIKQKLDSLNGYNFGSTSYTSVKDIDNELYALYNKLRESDLYWDSYALEKFADRLEFHLANPLTFQNKLPHTDSLMQINKTPDRKYKFYSFDHGGDGMTRSYDTYIQYLDDSGKATFHKWQDKVRFDCSKLYTALWQFQHKETTYYVAKSYKRDMSRSWGYYMEIFSLADGQPTYHTEFYPKGVYEFHEYKMVDLSKEEPEYYATAYDVCVCYTDFGNEISYSFDPKTKTVNITEYDESLGESASKKINRSWKLVNVE